MGIISLSNQKQSHELNAIINICKSSSGVCGFKLRKAHHFAGRIVGEAIARDDEEATQYAVIVMMRAGLLFGIGIADSLEMSGKRVQIFFSTHDKVMPDGLVAADYDKIALVDAVIKTGHGMIVLAEKLGVPEKTVFATNVLDETGTHNFKDKQVYTVRISDNSFTGAKQKNVERGKGPDTGDRLFDSGFMA